MYWNTLRFKIFCSSYLGKFTTKQGFPYRRLDESKRNYFDRGLKPYNALVRASRPLARLLIISRACRDSVDE